MRLLKYSLVFIPLIGIATWYGFQYFNSDSDNLPPLNTETVDYGDIARDISAYGAIKPIDEVQVGSQVSGIIDEVYADFNDEVEAGQVIAQIEPSTFRADVSSAEAELTSAEATLENAEARYERMQQLEQNDYVSREEVDEAKANLRQARAEVEVREHALGRAELELAQTTIHSPVDGIVISRDVDVGQTVAASLDAPEVFLIATHLDRMHIYARVSEADIGEVEEGQLARFHVDAYRGETFEGEVIQVRNAPIDEDNVIHYETIVTVDNEDGRLKPGMTAEVDIITEEIDGVLRVPNNALRARLPDEIRPPDPEDADEGDDIAYVISEDGSLEARIVETGLSDGVYTEVINGLEEGDELAVGVRIDLAEDDDGPGLLQGNQARY